MNSGVGPWMLCIGIFFIYPAVAFAVGYYVGKRGLPFEMHWKGHQRGLDQ